VDGNSDGVVGDDMPTYHTSSGMRVNAGMRASQVERSRTRAVALNIEWRVRLSCI
jgi:hypothetical protein